MYRLAFPQLAIEVSRRFDRKHPGARVKAARAYDAAHPDKKREGDRRRYWKNPERHRTEAQQRRRKFRENNPEEALIKGRRKNLKRTFGLTLEDYNQILKSQKEKCAICQIHYSEARLALAVDHCHVTGKIRGLLCDLCNRGLGFFKESEVVLYRAAEYLTKDDDK